MIEELLNTKCEIKLDNKPVMTAKIPETNVTINLYKKMSWWHQLWWHLLTGVTFEEVKK